jgi:hypothetical protein
VENKENLGVRFCHLFNHHIYSISIPIVCLIPADPNILCFAKGIDIGAKELELPAFVRSQLFDHAFNLRTIVIPTRIFMAVLTARPTASSSPVCSFGWYYRFYIQS